MERVLKQKVWKIADTLVITIPKPIATYERIEKGDTLHIEIVKVEKKK